MIKSVLYQPTLRKHSDVLFYQLSSLLLQTPRTIITYQYSVPQDPPCQDEQVVKSQEARNKLQKLLGIKEYKALNMVESCKKLLSTPNTCITENYLTCIKHKINKETVLKYPFLLCDPDLPKKLAELLTFPIPLTSSIPLARLSLPHLKFFMNFSEKETIDRIIYLCDTFNINPEQVCDIIATKPFMFTKSLAEFQELLTLLYESGLTKEDILKDLWVLKNSENHIHRRLEYLKYHNVKKIKTWMIRCQEEILYKKIRKESDNRGVLGENSLIEYLSQKLDCSESLVETLIRKYPQFRKMNLSKLNEMIDLLCNEGYTEVQICRCPKILFHSTSTIEQRLKEFARMGKKPEALYVLTKSEKQYYMHVNNLTQKLVLEEKN